MATIELVGLSRRYAGAESAALAGLELAIADGELVVLVGPSGCGKSTALRLVAGLDVPDAGSIRIGGRDVAEVPPQDRDVAMVFQGYALYPHLTVRDNIGFPLEMRGVKKPERARRIDETAAMLGLSKLLDRRPAELSGGERQRVAMGRAIVRSPKAFLFDEPLANLDAALRTELRVELAALVRRLGTTSIYVTHDQVEAMTMGDRIAVLRAGKLQQVGTPREIYEQPTNVFVASFLGTPPINLVELALEGGRLRAPGFDLEPPTGIDLPARVTAAIRPDRLRVGPSSSRPLAATIEARVVMAEPLGAETIVYLDTDGTALRAKAAGFGAPALGETVRLDMPADAILWFDAASGARLSPR